MHYASPSSLTTGSSACEQDICSCFLAAVVCPRTTSKAFQFLGLGCGLSEGGSLPSGVGGVSSKAAAPISSPALRSLHGRPDRPGSTRSTDLQSLSLSLSLSRPHLANDEAHALYHGYACSESTSASLRPKMDRTQNSTKIGKHSTAPWLPAAACRFVVLVGYNGSGL